MLYLTWEKNIRELTKEVIEQIGVEKQNKNPDKIRIYISHCWWSVNEALVLNRIMRDSWLEIETYNVWACYSSAFTVFMWGSKRFGYDWCTFMQHPSFTDWWSYHNEAKESVKDANYLQKVHKEMLKEVCPKIAEIDFTKETRFWWYREAKRLGIVNW